MKIKSFKTNKIYVGNCLEKMKELPSNSVDLVFADPPYTMTDFQHLKENVQNCLKPNGIFCMEMKKQNIDNSPSRIKYFGSTQVVFWKAAS